MQLFTNIVYFSNPCLVRGFFRQKWVLISFERHFFHFSLRKISIAPCPAEHVILRRNDMRRRRRGIPMTLRRCTQKGGAKPAYIWIVIARCKTKQFSLCEARIQTCEWLRVIQEYVLNRRTTTWQWSVGQMTHACDLNFPNQSGLADLFMYIVPTS